MKRLTISLSGILMLLLAFQVQSAFAVDVPLKKGDQTYPTISPTKTLSTIQSNKSILPVSVDLSETQLSVFFSNPVGIAVVRIEDQFGTTVCQAAVDTYVDSELYIPVDSLKAGQYKVKISYGSTSLVGEFEL